MRTSSRARSGIGRDFNGKLKMMNFTVLPAPIYQWSLMWGSAYSASRNLQWLQTSKANGFNAVRIFSFGLPDGDANGDPGLTINNWPDMATMRIRAAEFAQQCRTLGFKICVTTGGNANELVGPNGDRLATNLPLCMAHLALWDEIAPDIILYYDLLNEMNIFSNGNTLPTTWVANKTQMRSDLFQLVTAARKITSKPVTISVFTGSRADLTTNAAIYLDMQYDLSLDWHEIHCYWPVTSQPTPSDFATFEQRGKYLGRYNLPEFGTNGSNSDANTVVLFNTMGDISARPQCIGLGLWAIVPQSATASNDWGFCSDTAGTTVRTVKATNSAVWPGVL
jgi:hypothetical protein